jgi:transcriptional regulator with XRE-family HTH domain
MNQDSFERLHIKTEQQALLIELQQDYRLSKVEAHVLLERLERYFEEHRLSHLAAGQIIYPAVAFSEPAGRPLKECKLQPTILTLDAPEDIDALKAGGVSLLRKLRLFRLATEAVDQEARLTQEDFMRLLGVSRSTVRRIIAEYRDQNVFIPTRGFSKDIGRTLSHKVVVVEMFLNFATFSEIAQRLGEKVVSLKRYIRDFTRVLAATELDVERKKLPVITGLSDRLISEYLHLIERFDVPEYQPILNRLRQPPLPPQKKGVKQ